jgi:hypothetical protein
MILEDVLKNPALRKVLAVGEEQVGKVVGRLLASERVSAGLHGLLSSALHARDTFGRGVQQALHAANLPSREDVAALRERIAELESAIDGLAARVDAPAGRAGGGDGAAFDPAAPREPPDA